MKYYPKIKGEKCYLSPISLEDASKYTEWLNDLEIVRNLALSSSIITEHGEVEMLRSLSKEHNYAIVTNYDNKLIGNCGLVNYNSKNRIAELGIFIGDKDYLGKGFGTEAMKLLLSYCFNYLNIRNVMLRVFSFNEKAISCYKKIGFNEIGRRRKSLQMEGQEFDEIFMDLLNDEFDKK